MKTQKGFGLVGILIVLAIIATGSVAYFSSTKDGGQSTGGNTTIENALDAIKKAEEVKQMVEEGGRKLFNYDIQSIFIPEDNDAVIKIKYNDGTTSDLLKSKDLPMQTGIMFEGEEYEEEIQIVDPGFRLASLSPSGNTVVFVTKSVRGGYHTDWRWIGTINVTTKIVKKIKLDSNITPTRESTVVWSPNEKYLAMTRIMGESGINGIEIIESTTGNNLDGFSNTRFTQFSNKWMNTFEPQWSNDSLRLFFKSKDAQSASTQSKPNRWVINIDGTGLQKIL